MPMADTGLRSVLLVRSQTQLYALPLANVVEVLRPLPLERLEGAPDFVLGLSIVRGAPVPVVDLDRLFGTVSGPQLRLVTLRAGDRLVALAVADVMGIQRFAESELRAMPPLLTEACNGQVERLGRLDGELVMVLEAARLLPRPLLVTASAEAS